MDQDEFEEGQHEEMLPRRHWVIRGKMEAPPGQAALIPRPQLTTLLDQSLQYRLFLVTAPAGYGKTVTLAQWQRLQQKAGKKVAWLTLDEGESEPSQFLSYIIFALMGAGLNVGRLEMLAEQGLNDISPLAGVATLLDTIADIESETVLILDDYHRLHSAEVDQLVSTILSNCPRNFHLIISTRELPKLDMPRLVAYGQAQELGLDRLRFSREETKAAVNMALPQDALQTLFEKTEGWPVAVQLARVVLQSTEGSRAIAESFGGKTVPVAAYLTDQVIDSLSEDLREFLMQTSILERFNAPLANAICQRKDSWETLARLELLQALLIPLDLNGEWYRYHHLLSEYLQNLLVRYRAEEILALHLRASFWFEAEGYVAEAVRHARQAEDFGRCAALIADAGGWELILFGGIGYLRNLLRNIPEKELHRFPRLQIAKAYLVLKDGRVSESRNLLKAAINSPQHRSVEALDEREALERDLLNVEMLLDIYEERDVEHKGAGHYRAIEARVKPEDQVTIGIIRCASALSSLCRGEFDEGYACARLAMRAMREGNTILGLNYCYLHSGVAAFYRGRLREAMADGWQALTMAEDNFGADSGLRSLAEVLKGTIQYWRGELGEDDEGGFRTALDHVEQFDGWGELYSLGLEVQMGLAMERSDAIAVDAAIDQTGRIAAKRNIHRLEQQAKAYRLVAAVAFDRQRQADKIADELSEQFPLRVWAKRPVLWRPYRDAALALARYHDGVDNSKALSRMDDLIACCRHFGSQTYLIDALVMGAYYLDRSGHRTRAAENIFEAAQLASGEGIRKPFGVKPEGLPLLRYAMRHGREEAINSATLLFLSQCIEAAVPLSHSHAGLTSLFSPREREVLQELGLAHTNKQIARTLDMTEHTVKFHLKNIFVKLGVERRTEAVVSARKQGFL